MTDETVDVAKVSLYNIKGLVSEIQKNCRGLLLRLFLFKLRRRRGAEKNKIVYTKSFHLKQVMLNY